MVRVPSREATEEELRRVHTEAHVDRVFAFEDPMVAERGLRRTGRAELRALKKAA